MSDTTTTIQTDAGPISREDYITRAAVVYRERAGLTEVEARGAAEACADAEAEGVAPLTGRSPEDAANDDLDCWDNDE